MTTTITPDSFVTETVGNHPPQRLALPRCAQCDDRAEFIHLFSDRPAQLSCTRGDHDPDGGYYWIRLYGPDVRSGGIGSLEGHLDAWLRHLADTHRLLARNLLRWLSTDNGLLVLRVAAKYR
jgi:hypothetical protein